MRTLRHVGAGLLALTLAAGVAACGDDDSNDAESTDSGGEQVADDAAFCDAVVEFNTAVFQVDIGEDSTEEEITATGEEIGPIFQTIADEAPDELSDSAADLNETIQALTEGDAEAFNSDETFEQYTEFVEGSVEACDFEGIDVTAVDYSYQGIPEELEAGTTAFTFTNDSESEDHMMAILKKKDGVDLTWDELLALPEDEAEASTEFRGEAFAPAGETSATLADLDAGEYLAVCFIPVGSPEVEDGPPHFTEGMKQEFTVT
jgi:hypothetical protein